MPAAPKSTYALDAATVATVNQLALRWQVSKNEAVRRALREAAEREAITPEQRMMALRQLQDELHAKGVDFDAWKKTIRARAPLIA